MSTRRQAFVLAGALTATVLTTAAALAGISHRSPAQQQVSTPVAQVVQQAPVRPLQWRDD